MDSGWTPGGKQSKRGAGKEIDDLIGDLLDDDVPVRKKTPPAPQGGIRGTKGSKKQSSKDEDFYSSLAAAAEDDNASDISEADVGQMAKSIADLDDLDADLFGGKKPEPKRGSLKEKSGKPSTPRRTGTPRSRSNTPRASSPQRIASPSTRVMSPTVRGTSPSTRGTSPAGKDLPGRDTPTSPTGYAPTRQGSGKQRRSPMSPKPMSPGPVPEQKPSTAPGKMSDISSASASLKPRDMANAEPERPRTVPKAKEVTFGDFDPDDPLAGLISDDEEDFGGKNKSKPALKQQGKSTEGATIEQSQTVVLKSTKDLESPRRRNLLERPPTRSGDSKSATETVETVTPTPTPKPQPALTKKKSEDLIFSDDDDFMDNLGIDDDKPKPVAKPTEIEEEEDRPAKSIMDKLLNKGTISQHLETKERREFVLDQKYTKQDDDKEEDFQFGSYMPSAASTGSRPGSRRSVRFQDEDDIFGFDEPAPGRSAPGKKEDMDWYLEMSKSVESANDSKKTEPQQTPKAKQPNFFLTRGDEDEGEDEEEGDYLKSSSFSAPSRRTQPPVRTQMDLEKKRSLSESATTPVQAQAASQGPASSPAPAQTGLPASVQQMGRQQEIFGTPDRMTTQTSPQAAASQMGRQQDIFGAPDKAAGPQPAKTQQQLENKAASNDDYLGLGEEVDLSKLLRTKQPSPVFGTADPTQEIQDDIFSAPQSRADVSKSPGYEMGQRRAARKSPSPTRPDEQQRHRVESPSPTRGDQGGRLRRQSPSPTRRRESPRRATPARKEEVLGLGSPRVPLAAQINQISQLDSQDRQRTQQDPNREDNRFGSQQSLPRQGSRELLEEKSRGQQFSKENGMAEQQFTSRNDSEESLGNRQRGSLPPERKNSYDSLDDTQRAQPFGRDNGYWGQQPLRRQQSEESLDDRFLEKQRLSREDGFRGRQQEFYPLGPSSTPPARESSPNVGYVDRSREISPAPDTSSGTDFFSFKKKEDPLKEDSRRQERQEPRRDDGFRRDEDFRRRDLGVMDMPIQGSRSYLQGQGIQLDTSAFQSRIPPTGQLSFDAQALIRKLELELQYSQDVLASTKKRYEEEMAAVEKSYKSRMELLEETHKTREQRFREEMEQLMSNHLTKVRQTEQEKSELMSQHYNKMEEFEREKAQEIDRLKEIHREALASVKKDHDESLQRLKRSKDQQIEAAAASHDTSKSLVAAVELIQTNARDLGDLQKKMDSWHGQGLDEREIMIRSRDEQLRMLQERLNKQQEDNDVERQRLQDLIARLESQIREQTRMLEEERWKVKQEQSRLVSLQTSLEDERRLWGEQQARERTNMERNREALLEEQHSILGQLHKERQALAEERMEFNLSQKMTREEGETYSAKAAHARAEYEALARGVAETRDKLESLKEECRREEQRIREERASLERERTSLQSREEELVEAARNVKQKSAEMDDIYMTGQQKYDEGMAALTEAQRIESEEVQRLNSINHNINLLRAREKELTDSRLKLSKEKKEFEKLRNSHLCPNCRTPEGVLLTNGNVRPNAQHSPVQAPQQGLLMPANGQVTPPVPLLPPAMQLSINTVDQVTESIKADRSVRMWKMEAMKDQKYLEEQSLFLYTLKHMPYNAQAST